MKWYAACSGLSLERGGSTPKASQVRKTTFFGFPAIESGVRFVEILDGAEGRKWDAHGNRGGLVDNHRNNAARTDQGIAALITDLKSRGMLDETLIVWATEFGRTPFEEERKEKYIIRNSFCEFYI